MPANWFIPALVEENNRIDRFKMNYHCHDRLEIFYCKNGCVEIKWLASGAARSLALTVGDIAVIQPGVTHSLSIEGEAAFWVLELIESAATAAHDKFLSLIHSKNYRSLMEHPVVKVNDDNNVLFILKDIREELNLRSGELSETYLDCMLYALFSKLTKAYANQNFNSLGNVTVNKALNFINFEYKNPITVSDVARAAGVSQQYLRKLFFQTSGLNVIQYLTMTRVNKCVYYLTKTDYTMNTIAKAVGFNSVQSMDKNFKKLLGLTPSEYKTSKKHHILRMFNLSETRFDEESEDFPSRLTVVLDAEKTWLD